MLSLGRKTRHCERCGEGKYNAPFYKWELMSGGSKEVCHHCAIREMFGNNYKTNARYKRWIDEI